MAEVVWKDSGGQPVAEVTVGDVKYTLPDGVPVDIPIEHLPAVEAALNALVQTTSDATTGDVEI